VGNWRVYLINTDVFQLTTDLDSNYGSGSPTIVMQKPSYTWTGAPFSWDYLDFDRNVPFTRTPGTHLLMEIRWAGFSGQNSIVVTDYTNPHTPLMCRTWVWDHMGNNGVMVDNQLYATMVRSVRRDRHR
jgi:hypothetical protein